MFYIFSRWVVRVVLTFLYRVKVYGLEHEPLEGPVILCSNHRSNLDPPLVACYLRRKVHFMAKAELFKIPGFSQLIRHYGAFPVTRGGMNMETLKNAIQIVKQGNMLVIFPEGSRQKSGKLGEGKKGAASIALRGGAKIFPVAVIGEYKLFRPMKVVYGEPFDAAEAAAGEPSAKQGDVLTEKIMSSIQQLLDHHS